METQDSRLSLRRREIRSAALRSVGWLAAAAVVAGSLLGVVLLFSSVRVPVAGGYFGLELIDVGTISGCGPQPGWYSGTLLAIDPAKFDTQIGAYSVWYSREWGVVLQYANPGTPVNQHWRTPSRFIAEHPLTILLFRRIESGRLTRARLQQLLGPPNERRADNRGRTQEWIYTYPDWTGDFHFMFDGKDKVSRLNLGKG